MKTILLIILFSYLVSNSANAQHDYNWVFDSVLVQFDANGVIATGSSMAGQSTNETSWSDIQGNLVVYTRGSNGTGLYNSNHSLVPNSFEIKNFRQSQGTVFLPLDRKSVV